MKEQSQRTDKVLPAREQLLGIKFFNAPVEEAVGAAIRGGLVVAPSGTCFERFVQDAEYRRAILSADIVLPDSGLMVGLWRLLRRRKITRISGLAYLQSLLAEPSLREAGNVLWLLPNEKAQRKLLSWSEANGFPVSREHCYVAPIYGASVHDDAVLAFIEARTPRHVIIGLGAGAQEKLGLFLRERLTQRSAIHCIGGALGFITGDQVAIPRWADRLYLGWLFRLVSQPRVFIPRLWKARVLPWLISRYGEELPPLESRK